MLKKLTSILLGLILSLSFALAGCQPGAEAEADTGNSVPGAVAEAGDPQNVGDLKITAEGVPVEICLASDGQLATNMTKPSMPSRPLQTVQPLK